MAAAVAGGVTSLVCPPDTDPVLDEPGLVEMLKFRARKLQAHVHPLGALTVGLKGEVLTEMVALTESGCVGFTQAERAGARHQVLLRALQYASTLATRVAASAGRVHRPRRRGGERALASRLGLSGVPVAAKPSRCTRSSN
jgi:dihydroorotase